MKNATAAKKSNATVSSKPAIEQPCPECGSGGDKHEDNGCSARSVHYTILCTACGHQWSPNEG